MTLSRNIVPMNILRSLMGFDENMKPITRPAKTEIKVIHLATHASGYTYDLWDE